MPAMPCAAPRPIIWPKPAKTVDGERMPSHPLNRLLMLSPSSSMALPAEASLSLMPLISPATTSPPRPSIWPGNPLSQSQAAAKPSLMCCQTAASFGPILSQLRQTRYAAPAMTVSANPIGLSSTARPSHRTARPAAMSAVLSAPPSTPASAAARAAMPENAPVCMSARSASQRPCVWRIAVLSALKGDSARKLTAQPRPSTASLPAVSASPRPTMVLTRSGFSRAHWPTARATGAMACAISTSGGSSASPTDRPMSFTRMPRRFICSPAPAMRLSKSAPSMSWPLAARVSALSFLNSSRLAMAGLTKLIACISWNSAPRP